MIRLGVLESGVATGEPLRRLRSTQAADATAGRSTGTSRASSPVEESFRTLRSNLLLRAAGDVRTFLFTSATPGEGKSTIVANLASSMAVLDKRVLLIDADLRRPLAHRLFELANGMGLADVLRGTHPAGDPWQATRLGPMVLTSGPTPEDPQTLLESEAFTRLMAHVRHQFDVVLIDSAPLLAVADTTLIASRVDAAVLVVKYGGVSESEASLALERLRGAGGTVIGSVLSQVTEAADLFHSYASDYIKSGSNSRPRVRA